MLMNCLFLYTSIQERPELKLSSHGRKVHKLVRPVPAIEGLVAGTRLSPLIACSVDTGDRGHSFFTHLILSYDVYTFLVLENIFLLNILYI